MTESGAKSKYDFMPLSKSNLSNQGQSKPPQFSSQQGYQNQWQQLIDWINSFDDPCCLLVNQTEDLQNGVCLCHIVATLCCTEDEIDQMKQLICDDNIANLELGLCMLKASDIPLPKAVASLEAKDLVQNDVNVFMVFETLRQSQVLGLNKKFQSIQSPKVNSFRPYSEVTSSKQFSSERPLQQQSPSYKPLFNDTPKNRKIINEIQTNIASYDRVKQKTQQAVAKNQFQHHQPSNLTKDLLKLEQELKREEESIIMSSYDYGAKRKEDSYFEQKKSPVRLVSQSTSQMATPVQNYKQSERKKSPDEVQVMSQMQKLSVTPQKEYQIQIVEVDLKTKEKIINWLKQTQLIQKSVDLQLFPRYCRNGVLLSDLLNKLGGRLPVVKGINRKPETITAINSNFDKIFTYLREFPRFSSRYLWAQNKIVNDGDENVIWGFLDDIWYWSHNKTSPYDPAGNVVPTTFKRPHSQKIIQTQDDYLKGSIQQVRPELVQTKKPQLFKIDNFHSFGLDTTTKKPEPLKKSNNATPSATPNLTPRRPPKPPTAVPSLQFDKRNYSVMQAQRSASKQKSYRNSQLQKSNSQRCIQAAQPLISMPSFQTHNPIIRPVLHNWLCEIGLPLPFTEHLSLCEDPTRNGTFLCDLISITQSKQLIDVIRNPKNVQQCNYNIQLALQKANLDQSLAEQIMKGQQLNQVLEAIKNKNIIRPKTSGNALPYSIQELKQLENCVLTWMKKLKVVSDDVKNLADVMHVIRSGVLLCDLTSVVFNTKTIGVFRQPLSVVTMQQNIRKALDILRRQSNMSQKFTWSENCILEGKFQVILGLLEDLMRCADGLPRRKRGLDYFNDGPYLKQ